MALGRGLVAGMAGIGLVVGVAVGPVSADATPPSSITALGDSITAGVNVNYLFVTQPSYSWSTGTNTGVNSLANRLSVTSRKNLAVSGAKAADLPAQAAKVSAATSDDLLTILIGANDVCTSSAGTMTSVDSFTSSITTTLSDLKDKGVERVAISSIPDVNQLWELEKSNSSARLAWTLSKTCQSLLAYPSFPSLNIKGREAVAKRVDELNAAIASVCTGFCKYDDGAAHGIKFQASDVSTADYFHPSPSGQAKLSDAAYAAFGSTTWPVLP
jgi:lysophospholipase L1-like esterase